MAAGPAACSRRPAQGMVRELARVSHRGEPGRLFKAGGWWRSGFAASQAPARNCAWQSFKEEVRVRESWRLLQKVQEDSVS